MNESREDLIGIIATLVERFDEASFDIEDVPEDVQEILHYIETVCRHVVKP